MASLSIDSSSISGFNLAMDDGLSTSKVLSLVNADCIPSIVAVDYMCSGLDCDCLMSQALLNFESMGFFAPLGIIAPSLLGAFALAIFANYSSERLPIIKLLACWLLLGFIIYFLFRFKKSKLVIWPCAFLYSRADIFITSFIIYCSCCWEGMVRRSASLPSNLLWSSTDWMIASLSIS